MIKLDFDNLPTTNGWHLNPFSNLDWEMEAFIQSGGIIATVEHFHDERAYPHALDPATGFWHRGGCFIGVPAAKSWAEKMCGAQPKPAGLHEGGISSPFVGD